jgi:hypothetical protein
MTEAHDCNMSDVEDDKDKKPPADEEAEKDKDTVMAEADDRNMSDVENDEDKSHLQSKKLRRTRIKMWQEMLMVAPPDVQLMLMLRRLNPW